MPTDDSDSAFSDDSQTVLSSSLRSSIYNHRYENGRTYHAFRDGQYPIPNDEEEQARLDLLHHLFTMVLGGELYTAPLPTEPQRVLDVGTGTGIWAIEMADRFPTATVVGTDLSPIQPGFVPPNVQFYIDDAESDWIFRDFEKFDFIHGRALCGGIADWPRLYAQAYDHLEPGGWMEMQDHECWINSDDGGMERAPGCTEWIHEVDRASAMFGKRLNIAHLHRQWMIDAGFEGVTEMVRKVCIRGRRSNGAHRLADPHRFLGKRPQTKGNRQTHESANDPVNTFFCTCCSSKVMPLVTPLFCFDLIFKGTIC